MHDLFTKVLSKRDLSRAGDLFSVADDEIVNDLTDVVRLKYCQIISYNLLMFYLPFCLPANRDRWHHLARWLSEKCQRSVCGRDLRHTRAFVHSRNENGRTALQCSGHVASHVPAAQSPSGCSDERWSAACENSSRHYIKCIPSEYLEIQNVY